MGMIQQATTDAGAVLAVVCLALSFSATNAAGAYSYYYYSNDDYGYYGTYKSSAHLQAGKYTFLKYIFN